MAPPRLSAMWMLLIFEFDGNGNKASVTHTALGDDMLSEVSDIAHRAPEHRDFHAAVVIKVDVHRRNRQIVVLVKGPSQALG
jgi:hypothetical protein